ncbi:MAG TPA: MG2 domain-containing protein [Steroidobacteraceae bacterium]
MRQVVARFSAPMVALGDPRLQDPFVIDCPASGRGRWADPSNWVYDFDQDLDAGNRCRFVLRSDLRSAAGSNVAGRSEFVFDTGGPAVVASLPNDGWSEIDEEQVFLLRLDAPADVGSIESHSYCAIDGLAEGVPVQVLTGQERRAALEQRRALGYDYLQLLWKRGAISDVRVRNRGMEQREELITVLRCQRHLPAQARVLLHWGAGIATASGIATQVDQHLSFSVRPAFAAEVQCTRTNARAGCVPVLPITVSFSAPVARARAQAIRLRTSDGRLLSPTIDKAQQVPTLQSVSFAGPFPESASVTLVMPSHLTDDAGRSLSNAARFPLPVAVGPYPPLVKFSGDFGILEAREGGVLPVTLRNVEPRLDVRRSGMPAKLLRLGPDAHAIADWLTRVEQAGRPDGDWQQGDAVDDAVAGDVSAAAGATHRLWHDTTGTHSVFHDADDTVAFTLAKAAGSKTEEVIGIPLKDPGFYVVEIASRVLGSALLGRDQIRYVATAALVTDLAVHFKWGRESSLVWVTRLSDGTPVADAEVSVNDFCSGAMLWQGHTDAQGIAAIAQTLGEPSGYGGCRWQSPRLVLARKGGDFSFSASSWDQGITPDEFGLPIGNGRETGIYHTVLDRSLYRAGESVSMKHELRQHDSGGINLLPGAQGTHQVVVAHLGSGQHYALQAVFDEAGVATSVWQIPEEAHLGTYRISIDGHPSGQFRVEQFRLPSMRATLTGSPRPAVAPRRVDLDLHVAWASGGGAGGLPVKIRTLVEPLTQSFEGYADYEFEDQPVREGVVTEASGAADLDFESDFDAPEPAARSQIIPVNLDESGSAHVSVDHLPDLNGPARLTAELEYADANGETLTTSTYVRLTPAAVSLGIRPENWIGTPGQLRFRVLALTADGQPRAGQLINVALYQSSRYSYRKRLMGGFYSYESVRDTQRLKPGCHGVTDAHGLLLCELSPGASGQIIVRAETRDAQGASAGATTTLWSIGTQDWWFGGTAGDRMDVLPEKKEYQPGDTARLQVRMPFRNATALVTVEREGVLSGFVTQLQGNAPIVEVPISADYSPNAFVSVLAIRGRVAHADGDGAGNGRKPDVSALVDLTKPAYRLGTAQIKVGWRPHRLEVQVRTDRASYQVRDQVNVSVHVARADGQPLPAGSELAVAAVDEALLQLAPNPSWDLLAAMMGERGLEVWTSTAQMQVVGKRHYGRKAIPHGGGGGREVDRARELFDSLLGWQARVRVDAQGNAALSIPLNDSLSSFRIVAIAQSGAALFGTGSASIRTTRDVILTSGLPPTIREGDRFDATFTVRNTTDQPITAQVQTEANALGSALPARSLQIPAGAARDAVWTVTAPVGPTHIDWDVRVHSAQSPADDRLKLTQTLLPVYPVRTYQATIAQLSTPISLALQRPHGALEGRGAVEVKLQSTLADNLDGVREYMSRYPYICLEQLASRAIALRSRLQWDALMQRLPAYMDDDGLLRYFPSDRLQGDDSLSAYILSIANEADWPLQDADRSRLLQALTRFAEGRLQRNSALPTADLSVRKLQAIAALARYGAARADMLDSLDLQPQLLPTSAVLDWIDILERVPGIASAEANIELALRLLRARLNFQGTTMGFSTERQDALWWLMISADSNANRMLLSVLKRADWKADVPRLVRGALGRQQFGHWNTTVANAWGMLAMEKFSAAFESVPVSGDTMLVYGEQQKQLHWPATSESPIALSWQSGVQKLQLVHRGSGAPWAMVRATAALPLEQPLSTGFRIERQVLPLEQQRPGHWTRGDVLRVQLDLEAQSDMSWVVVDDPIPAGALILGSGLGGQSELLQYGQRSAGWAWLAFEEHRFEGFRAYYRLVPKGHWHIEYTLRVNNPGTFLLPPTRVEAMYAPEMFAELPNAPLSIDAAGASP